MAIIFCIQYLGYILYILTLIGSRYRQLDFFTDLLSKIVGWLNYLVHDAANVLITSHLAMCVAISPLTVKLILCFGFLE